MRVIKISDLEKADLFEKTDKLFGYETFREFEKEYDDRIFYADGSAETVINAMREEFHAKPFSCINFDGWFLAII